LCVGSREEREEEEEEDMLRQICNRANLFLTVLVQHDHSHFGKIDLT
jgi:hypothetical protein